MHRGIVKNVKKYSVKGISYHNGNEVIFVMIGYAMFYGELVLF